MLTFTKEKQSKGRPDNKASTPVKITSATKSASVATITFDQPVILKGIPAYTVAGVAGVHATAATMTSPTVLALTFSGAITAGTAVTIPFQEPAIRNSVGGYVSDSTFPLS